MANVPSRLFTWRTVRDNLLWCRCCRTYGVINVSNSLRRTSCVARDVPLELDGGPDEESVLEMTQTEQFE